MARDSSEQHQRWASFEYVQADTLELLGSAPVAQALGSSLLGKEMYGDIRQAVENAFVPNIAVEGKRGFVSLAREQAKTEQLPFIPLLPQDRQRSLYLDSSMMGLQPRREFELGRLCAEYSPAASAARIVDIARAWAARINDEFMARQPTLEIDCERFAWCTNLALPYEVGTTHVAAYTRPWVAYHTRSPLMGETNVAWAVRGAYITHEVIHAIDMQRRLITEMPDLQSAAWIEGRGRYGEFVIHRAVVPDDETVIPNMLATEACRQAHATPEQPFPKSQAYAEAMRTLGVLHSPGRET
jgi:hypothetical protein